VAQFAGPRARLLVTGLDRAARPTVEVAHETLIRTWPRLRAWIDINREKLRARAAVVRAKAEWEQQGRREDLLLPKARELFEKAAVEGNAFAMTALGLLYEKGQGGAQDYVKTRELFEKAANKGNAFAMTALGLLYENGRGGAQDYVKARELFEKAADKGDAFAMIALGLLYENGQGGAQDYVKARELFEKAADRGYADAIKNLEKLSIDVAAAGGRYVEALQLQKALAEKSEAVETKCDGSPGQETAIALSAVVWRALFARRFTEALAAADRAHALLPDSLQIEINRAHALMFLERSKEAETLYLAHKGKPISEQNNMLWERVVDDDFLLFRKADLTHPMMADIEKQLAVSH
jgi:hypothetical protein